MAHLLGGKNCMESLSKDISDLQETLESILTKVGRGAFVSWKFPGKNAVDTNINEMLEDYSYCKDEESNTLSHIIMFELVIDRFCFLLQVTSRLFDKVMNDDIDGFDNDKKRPQSQTVTATMSIGLISKKFWSKLSQFQYRYKNLLQNLRENNQALMDLEQATSDLRVENQKLRQQKRNNIPKLAINFEGPNSGAATLQEVDTSSEHDQDTNKSSISTQTFETAFVECMTCDVLQSHLLEIGSCVVSICENQNLPSSTNKHNKILRNTKLSPSNVDKWSGELQKDMKRMEILVYEKDDESKKLNTKNEELLSKIKQLEKVVHELESEKAKFNCIKTELELKCNFHSKQCDDLQTRVTKLEKDLFHKEESMNKRNEQLSQLEEEYKISKVEITELQTSNQSLEQSLNNLSLQLEGTKGLREKNKNVDKELGNLKEKTEELENELQSTMNELTKLKSEKKMLLKHDQSLQSKQSSLLSRIENLDEQCDSLQTQLNDVTEEKEDISNENEEFRKKIVQLEDKQNRSDIMIKHANSVRTGNENTNENLQQDVNNLEEMINLLVCYPVIKSDDYQHAEKKYTQIINNRRFQGHHDNNEGDVLYDMEQQLNANTTRVAILEKQNNSLRNTLMKFDDKDQDEKQKSTHETDHEHNKTLPTNQRSTKSAPHRNTSNINNNTEYEPRPPSPSKTRQNVRPRSAGRRSKDDIQSRLDSLEKLKNTAKQAPVDKSMNNNWVANSQQDETTSFACPDCKREHVSKRDLDIHKPFCFNRQ